MSYELVPYSEFSPETIGENVHRLAQTAMSEGTFDRRRIVGVAKRNSTPQKAVENAEKALTVDGLNPFLLVDGEQVVGVATLNSQLRLNRLKHFFVPTFIARRVQPSLSEEIENVGQNVFAWTLDRHAEQGALDVAYKGLVDTVFANGNDAWTVEPTRRSMYISEAINNSGLSFVDDGLFDDGEISGLMIDKYSFFRAES